ncbi:ABC transporter permease [Microbacterium terricola]|uniref:Membrane protein n=1 Tax=Microbacterium terricola TaxID=344163 RepID=A0ABM8E254_9MICO|nr:ABC transporter permease [Microbacterium terricola]UYK40417.1 ABC transporter permease [Microbacterium terricola]BDV31865.1 membrane protein [Microbacterium terricola]
MSEPTTPRTGRFVTRWPAAIAISAAAAIAVAVIVLAFLWPVVTAEAKDVPLGLVGPEQATSQVESALDEHADGVFDTTTYDTRDEAVDAIEQRKLYGAVVVGTEPEVIVASAASPAVATMLRSLAGTLQAQVSAQLAAAGQDPTSVTVAVTDVVPLVDEDPNGSGLVAIGFPIVLGGMLGGILISLLVAGVARRLTALAVYAVAAGTLVTLIAHTWFGILPGDFLALATGLSLAMLGTASFIVGMNALIGPPGIAVGAILTMLVGNPISAAAMPAQFLVGPWGQIGQYFVPGAAATLIRDLSYFPAADMTQPWLVLGAWAIAGVLLSALGHWRNREVVHIDALEEELPASGA